MKSLGFGEDVEFQNVWTLENGQKNWASWTVGKTAAKRKPSPGCYSLYFQVRKKSCNCSCWWASEWYLSGDTKQNKSFDEGDALISQVERNHHLKTGRKVKPLSYWVFQSDIPTWGTWAAFQDNLWLFYHQGRYATYVCRSPRKSDNLTIRSAEASSQPKAMQFSLHHFPAILLSLLHGHVE